MSFKLIATTLLAMVVSSGCTKGGKDIEVVVAGGTKQKLLVTEALRVRVASEPPSLDWEKATDTASAKVTDQLMEGLVQYDLKDKELGLLPALALKWEPSENARKWKFTIRTGVVWSDGQAFTAQHVLDGWKRLTSRETASEYAYFLFGIKNAKAYNEGKVSWEEVGAKITGPNEISVELERSMSYFPYLLAHHSTHPIRLDVIAKHGDKWTEPGNLVTVGPYKLLSWEHDKLLAVERNDSYYGDKPAVKYIVFYMIQEVSTAINLFDSGKLDEVSDLPSVELRKLRSRKEFRENSRLSNYYYGFNVTKPPMNNVNVRKAIAQAIDRQQIVTMLQGGQNPMTSFIPAGMFGYEPERGLTFNPEKAKESLKAAGYDDPKKLPKIEIRFNTSDDHQRIAENVQAQLKTNLGIDVELKNEEWKVFLNTLKTDPPHIFRLGWQADFPDPDNFIGLMSSYSEQNRTRWKNTKYDELVARGAGELNKEERRKIYSEAQKILVEDDVPLVPFYASVNHILVSDRVDNFPLNVMERFQYKQVKFK